MNFVEGRVQVEDGRGAFVAEGVRIELPAELMEGVRAAEPTTLGVRPEHLRFVTGGPLPGEAAGARLRGRVLLVERLGGTSHIHFEVGPHRLLVSVSGELAAGRG
jgi:multiple sugar transport system ATP-binding protein